MLDDFANDKSKEYGIIVVKKKDFEYRLNLAFQTNGDMKDYYYWDKVVYYSDIADKSIHLAFRKRMRFSHQHEIRLLLPTVKCEKNQPYWLELGSLRDISIIMSLHYN